MLRIRLGINEHPTSVSFSWETGVASGSQLVTPIFLIGSMRPRSSRIDNSLEHQGTCASKDLLNQVQRRGRAPHHDPSAMACATLRH